MKLDNFSDIMNCQFKLKSRYGDTSLCYNSNGRLVGIECVKEFILLMCLRFWYHYCYWVSSHNS